MSRTLKRVVQQEDKRKIKMFQTIDVWKWWFVGPLDFPGRMNKIMKPWKRPEKMRKWKWSKKPMVKKMWKWWSRIPWDHPMEEIRAGCNCLPQAHCCKKENSDPNISFSLDYIDFDNLFLCLSSYFVWWYFVGIYQIGWKVSEKSSLLLIIVIRLH